MEKETGSLMEQALKEGIATDDVVDTPVTQDAPAESSPAKESVETAPAPKESESPAAKTDELDWSKVPAHLHPVSKQLLDEKRELRKMLAEKEALLKDPRITRLLAGQKETESPKVEEKQPPKQEQTLEQREAIEKLREVLGISNYSEVSKTIEQLKQRNEELTKKETERAFEQEESTLHKRADEFGLDWETEVEPELTAWFQKNPQFQGLGPGSISLAFNAVYFDRIGELKERAATKKLIQERDKLKTASSESPQRTGVAAPKKLPGNMRQHLEDTIKAGGGIEL